MSCHVCTSDTPVRNITLEGLSASGFQNHFTDNFYLGYFITGEFQIGSAALWNPQFKHVIFILLVHDYLHKIELSQYLEHN